MAKILAVMSTENIWMGISRADDRRQKQLEDTQDKFRDFDSDHMSLALIYDEWCKQRKKGFQQLNQWCWQNCLQQRALFMAKNIAS